MPSDDIALMKQLLSMAKQAGKKGEVPIAAMLVDKHGTILARAHNQVEANQNPFHHAEIVVMQRAMKKIGKKYLLDCRLITTLEPCHLCAAAIGLARIKTLVFGGYDEKMGGVLSGARLFAQKNCHHIPDIIDGILANESEKLMQEFFQNRR
ncbi:MAG: nucleoside deaminase [Alphaproteobacteria bacterium]